jgi:flavin-dependent dehydrogenase
LELYVYPGGYGGCSEIEDGYFNTCFMIKADRVKQLGNNPELVWRESLMKNPRASEALGAATVDGEWLAVPITKLGVGHPAPAKGLLSVGDAASFIDPFTGSGIALALETSRLAAEAIVENADLEDIATAYSRKYDATLKRRMRFSSYIRMAGRSEWLSDGLIWLLNRNERLRKFAARRSRLNDSRRNA